MPQKKCALIFSQDPEGKGIPALRQTLERTQINPILPHQMTPEAGRVVVIIIERPAANAATILANIRRHEEFSKLPILVILESAERAQAAQFSAHKADVLFKPVNATALQRYMEGLNGAAPDRKAGAEGASGGAGPLGELFERPAQKSREPPAPARGKSEEKGDAERAASKPPQGGKSSAGSTQAKSQLDAKIEQAVVDLERVAKAVGEKARAAPQAGGRRAEKERVLEDVIPPYTSSMLLSAQPRSAEAKKGGAPCANCRRWKARREDPSCSRCGAALIALELPGDEVSFEPLGDHTVGVLLDLRNAGQNSLWMSFRVVADEQLARRFKLHTAEAVLEGKDARRQLITFDARGLDLTTGYQGSLEIVTNERGLSRRSLKLVVERKSVPRVEKLSGYVFALGSENVWEFGLANDGGGTLRLQGASLDAWKDFAEGAQLGVPAPFEVRGGQTAVVRLRVPELNLPIGPHTRKLVWKFEHHPPLSTDFTFEVKRPPSIAVRPLELDFGVVSASRSKSLNIELVNNGGEELVVESVRPSEKVAPWLECRASVPFPLRIPPGDVRLVEMLARGGQGEAGEQRGEVVVRSNSFQNPAQAVNVAAEFVSPTSYEHYVGIDFGTTASCVAVLDRERRPTLLEIDPFDHDPALKGDPRLMPSVLFFHDDGRVIAGREALVYAAAEPHKSVASIKRSLGLKQKKVIADKEYDAVGVTSQIIEQLLQRAEDGLFQLGEYKTPSDAVLTVPIEFLDSQRRALLEACAQAGLNTESSSQQGIVIDEAQAAALYYLSRKDPEESTQELERVLIFDWGGGTLDCALTEIEGSEGRLVMRTLALGGDPRLGGEDIDWALVGLLADKAKDAFPEFDKHCLDDSKFEHHYRSLPVLSAAYQTRAQFKRRAEAAKIALGRETAATVTVTPLLRVGATPIEPYITDGAGRQAAVEATLTRDELELVLSKFLESAARVVNTLCERAATRLSDVHTILHTGRTSLLPMVRKHINRMLPDAKDRSDLVGQKVCVAMGAAFWGHIKDLPDADFEFIGAANRSIHDIGYKKTVFLGGIRDVFVPVFGAQTAFPCEKVVEFGRTKETIKLEMYENRGKNTAVSGNSEISYIGSVRIDTRGMTGERVPVRFVLNENRMLEIIANERRQVIELDGEN